MTVVQVEHFARNWENTFRITGMQGKNKHGDPIFLLELFKSPMYGCQ